MTRGQQFFGQNSRVTNGFCPTYFRFKALVTVDRNLLILPHIIIIMVEAVFPKAIQFVQITPSRKHQKTPLLDDNACPHKAKDSVPYLAGQNVHVLIHTPDIQEPSPSDF